MAGYISSTKTVLLKDVRTSMRDSVVTYMMVGPLLLALAARLVLPLLEAPPISFVVTAEVPAELSARLGEVGELTVVDDEAAAKERVGRIDDVPGVVMGSDGRVKVLLEGNESAWVKELPGELIDLWALESSGEALPAVSQSELGAPSFKLKHMLAALLGFSIFVICGISVGFSVIEEKESGTLRALQVAPMTFAHYATAKLLFALALSFVLAPVCLALVFGTWVLPWGAIFLALVSGAPVALSLGFVVGTAAEDQLSAIALLKGALFFYTSVPIAGFFDLGAWGYALWPLPNHWAVQALFGAFEHGAVGREALIAFGYGGLVLAGVLLWMQRRLGLTRGSPALVPAVA